MRTCLFKENILKTSSHNQPCELDNHCAIGTGLTCKNSKCSCSSRNQSVHWHDYYKSCTDKWSTLNEPCKISDDCDQNLGLECLSNKCKCSNENYKFWSFNNKMCQKCPHGWKIYTDHCYLSTSSQLKTWLEANETCSSLNKSHLMVVNDQNEFEMLKSFFLSTFGDRVGSLWIGAETFTSHRPLQWKWVDGSKYFWNESVKNWWCKSEPNNHRPPNITLASNQVVIEGCMELYNKGVGDYGNICFNDIPCTGKKGYVCEYG